MESSMDIIDIIDPMFSLDVLATDNTSSTSYFYVGAVIVLVLASILAYRFFQNKNDCTGGFCTMGQNNDQDVEADA